MLISEQQEAAVRSLRIGESFAFAVTLVALAATGSLPALAQSASAFGSPLPTHHNGAGERVPGWYAENPSARRLAHAQSRFKRLRPGSIDHPTCSSFYFDGAV
jgi:hypothetical protein